MNGVCGASRLVGVYHLWPQIIPIPSTESVELRAEDEYIIIATNSLWKYVTYDQIVHEVKSISDPIQAAKRLRDLVVAHGCSMDVSVTVVKLKIDSNPPIRSFTDLQALQSLLEPDAEEEEDDDDPGVTNIDDPISKEDMESERNHMLPIDSATQESMDRLVLGAISSPLGFNGGQIKDGPMMQSTNLPLSDESPTPVGTDSTPSDLPHRVAASESRGQQPLLLGYAKQHDTQTMPKQQQHQMEMDYETQTMPSQARKSVGLETSLNFEQTQVSHQLCKSLELEINHF